MPLYLLLAVFILIALMVLVRWFATAEPQDIKRILFLTAGLVLVGIGIMLFKYGAVIAGAVLVIIPMIRRFWRVLLALLYVRRMKNKLSQGNKKSCQNAPAQGVMSVKEAQEILGVDKLATKKEIKAAYVSLMQKNHPDQGGSEYFAKQLNQARDILLDK